MKKYVCTICGYIYDEAAGIPGDGIVPGTKWESLPGSWVCPVCGASKGNFREVAEQKVTEPEPASRPTQNRGEKAWETIGGRLTAAELSALCSNLAKGCEKQYLGEESTLFLQLADYFKKETGERDDAAIEALTAMAMEDLENGYPAANDAALEDRGAKRALVWGEKVTRIVESILQRYEKEGDSILENTNIYVCDICGFIYLGEEPPAICPVCKVPSWKMTKIERRAEAV